MDFSSGYLWIYEVKYTTWNPIQLAITPIAQYELVNMSGRNSYFSLNTTGCTIEVYMIKGMAMAVYMTENRSRRKNLCLTDLLALANTLSHLHYP
jgi:hypothetical protein